MFNMASVLRILDQYGVPQTAIVKPYGNGLINHTWKVTNDKNENFILQRINTTVFKQPEDIASNLANLRDYLQKHFPRYPYISPLRTIDGMEFYYDEHDFYRLFPFVAGSHSIDTVQTAEQAFEAAKQFGLFSKLLSGFDHRQLKTTIPDFHNLSLRYYQFQQAIRDGDSYRIGEAKALIDYLQQQESIVQKFESIQNHEGFKIRVMHHDTKINNVLFDQHNKGICVIDLDTV